MIKVSPELIGTGPLGLALGRAIEVRPFVKMIQMETILTSHEAARVAIRIR